MIKEDLYESYHGYALCQFKEGHPEESIQYLDKAINMMNN
jgi:hypothetical protein